MAIQTFLAIILLRMQDHPKMSLFRLDCGGIPFMASSTTALVCSNAIPASCIVVVIQVFMTGQAGIGGRGN
jgi:hypothetical protein